MSGGPRVLSIQEFLFAYVLGEGLDELHDVDDIDVPLAHLRAQVARHQMRTGVSRDSGEPTTRCRSCRDEDGWPCTALRVLAEPYARHPAYRSEWRMARTDVQLIGAEGGPDRGR